jgi:hypothetical protein
LALWAQTGETSPTWALGGIFGLLAAVFGITLRILLGAQKRSDDNAATDRANLLADIGRLTDERDSLQRERDKYFNLWLECRQGQFGAPPPPPVDL